MMATKKKRRYLVLKAIRDKKRRDVPGDIIQDGDYNQSVIANWLELDPPVLEVIQSGSD